MDFAVLSLQGNCRQSRNVWQKTQHLFQHTLQEVYLPVVVDVSLLHPSFGIRWEKVVPNCLHYPRSHVTASSGFLLAIRWETDPALRVSAENLCIQSLNQEKVEAPAMPLYLPR